MAEMKKTAGREEKWRWPVPDQEVTFLTCFGHVRFALPIKQVGDVKGEVGYRNLKL